VGDDAAGLKPRIERTRQGDYRLRLTRHERDALRSLPGQLRELFDTDDPSLVRLFPPAYADDPASNAEYERLTRDSLLAGRLQALRMMEETVDADRLTEEQLSGWLSALNDLRLVLGTRLDVTEDVYERELDRDDPRAPELALYAYLSWLQEQAVEALANGYESSRSQ
jgi:Domain of unknown function (DUF2017)